MALDSEKIIECVQKILLRCETDGENILLYKGKEDPDELDYAVCAVCILGRSSRDSFTIPIEMFGGKNIKKQIKSVKALLKYRKMME